MKGTVLAHSLFGEEFDEELNLIRYDDSNDKEVKDVQNRIKYNSGWYNYHEVQFDYKGKRYVFEYKEHTSDNVSDCELNYDSLVCLGEVAELAQTVTKEELVRAEVSFQKQIEQLEKKNLQLQEENRNLKKPYDKIRRLEPKHIEWMADTLMQVEKGNPQAISTIVASFLSEVKELKSQKKI